MGAITYAVVQRKRGRHVVPPVVKVVPLVALLGLHSFWSPSTWWNTVVGWYDDVEPDVKNWVHDAINIAVGGLDDVWSDLWGALTDIANDAARGVSAINNWIDNTVDWLNNLVEHTIPDAFSQAVSYAQSGLDYVENLASGWVDNLGNWADNAFNSVWSFVDNEIIPAVNRASSWIANATGFVGQIFQGLWNEFWAAAIAPIIDDIESLAGQVAATYDYVYGQVTEDLHVVEGAWDWLVWMGEHSFEAFESLFTEGVGGFGPGFIASTLNETSTISHDVEGWFEQLLGS